MSSVHDEAFPEFEALGEPEVRRRLACNQFHIMRQEPARAWLLLKEAEAVAHTAARETEANRIASEDLAAARSSASSAFEQSRWAKWVAIIAIVAAIIATKDQILALIF